MADLMWRTAKHEGVGNVVMEQVPIPEPGDNEVVARTQVSLISRGSEMGGRYLREELVDPRRMGYSTTGVIHRVGTGVSEFAVGDRVVVTAPHAEYTLEKVDYAGDFRVFQLHPDLSLEHGTFHPLATSSAGWTRAAGIGAEDRVVVLGQGIVGNLVMQFARRYQPAQLIAVDALDLRLRIAQEVGASEVVNAREEDPVAAVQRLTGGGATIVMDCVGGRAGLRSFVQAQDMVTDGGLIQLIGLYHEQPLDLDASKIMGKRLIGSYPPSTSRAEIGQEAMAALVRGEVRVEPLITHRFEGQQAKEAFDLLHEHMDQALGVLLTW